MSIDEVLKRNTIQFGKPLALKEVEQLLADIAKDLPANISYKVCYQSYVCGQPLHNKNVAPEMQGISVHGTIIKRGKNVSFDTFECKPMDFAPLLTDALHFATTPGWELDEYGLEKIKLWDTVRTLVEKYVH